jgi:hypothetical protein
MRTSHPACAAVTAFVTIQYERRFVFYGIRAKNVHRTDIYTDITAVADAIVEQHRWMHESSPFVMQNSTATRSCLLMIAAPSVAAADALPLNAER